MERNPNLGHRKGSGIGDHPSVCVWAREVVWCCVGDVEIGMQHGNWVCVVSSFHMSVSSI